MSMRRILLLLPLALPLAACGGGGSSSNAAGGSSSQASAPVMQSVMIGEKEFSLTPSSISLTKPGEYSFQVRNNGQIGHALEIEGHGVEQKTGTIDPGSSATLNVDLAKAGSYEVYCPIDGHKNKGMRATLTVGGSAATGGAGTSTEGATTEATSTGQSTTNSSGSGY
jgi:plastocyanin